MNLNPRLMLIAAAMAASIVAGTWLAGPDRAGAQLQTCTFGPSRPLTEATIYDRQPQITISATCPGSISRVEGYIDGQGVPLEQTGLGTTQVSLRMRPAAPLNLGVHVAQFLVDGSLFSWGFTVESAEGKVWSSTPTGTEATCPQATRSWQLLYWGGSGLTSIDAAASLCPNVDLIWLNRGGRWLGYAAGREETSDMWIILDRGEAHFLRAR
jgi:hypothetical protein